MNTTEILGKLIESFDGSEDAPNTKKLDKIADEMYENIVKNFNSEQEKILHNFYLVMTDLSFFSFKDGVICGIKLATQLQEILKEPYKNYIALSQNDKSLFDIYNEWKTETAELLKNGAFTHTQEIEGNGLGKDEQFHNETNLSSYNDGYVKAIEHLKNGELQIINGEKIVNKKKEK